jgi:hypothetical protein
MTSSAEDIKTSDDENVGYSCFKEPAWPNDKVSKYLCVFELNTVSPFYDGDKRNKIVSNFTESLNSNCKVSKGKEMIEANAIDDHGMFLIAYHVMCS